jgi:RNA polymerase sigma-70 factor (ECF subfamily)
MATCSPLVEDQNLLDGISRRLPNDLAELYRRYAVLLKSVIMQVLHDESEAKEILQDVFCQVWEHADH